MKLNVNQVHYPSCSTKMLDASMEEHDEVAPPLLSKPIRSAFGNLLNEDGTILVDNIVEQEVKLKSLLSDRDRLQLQSSMTDHLAQIMRRVKESATSPECLEYNIKLLEDLGILIGGFWKAETVRDFVTVGIIFLKLRLGKSLILAGIDQLKIIQRFFTDDDLKEQSFEETTQTARITYDKVDSLLEAKLWPRLYKFLIYIMNLALYAGVLPQETLKDYGIWEALETHVVDKGFSLVKDFFKVMVETIIYLCEIGGQCFKTGSIEPIIHNGASYVDWLKASNELINDYRYIHNPELKGYNVTDFVFKLRNLIEQGVSLAKYSKERYVNIQLDKLLLMEADYLTKTAASSKRRAPFAMVVYGGSGVAKSCFTSLCAQHFAKSNGLTEGDACVYVRNFDANFWDGYDTSKHTIIMDDVAILQPKYCPSGDPSLGDFIRIVNNVGFCPDQADLSAKGRTPMKCELVIATTNTVGMNIDQYFQTPLAVSRRFPFVIDLQLKPEYCNEMNMFDASKADTRTGEWPNFWLIEVLKVMPVAGELDGGLDPREGQRAKLEKHCHFSDIKLFLKWFFKITQEHRNNQQSYINALDDFKTIKICRSCGGSDECDCLVEQALNFTNVTDHISMHPNIDDSCRSAIGFLTWNWGYWLLFFFLETICMYNSSMSVYILINVATFIYGHVNNMFLMLAAQFIDYSLEYVPAVMSNYIYRYIYARMRATGDRVERVLSPYRDILQYAKWTAEVLTVMFFAYKMCSVPKGNSDLLDTTVRQQNNIGEEPKAKDEKDNVWFKSDYALTAFDVSETSKSWKGLGLSRIVDLIAPHCVDIEFRKEVGIKISYVHTKAFCIGGRSYIVNNHALPSVDCSMEVITAVGHMSCHFSVDNVRRIKQQDLAMIEILGLPPRKDVTQLFGKGDLSGLACKSYYIGREETGLLTKREVTPCRYRKNFCYGDERRVDCWENYPQRCTQAGDCGTILLADTQRGPIILGFHMLGNEDKTENFRSFACSIDQDMINSLRTDKPEDNITGSNFKLNSSTTTVTMTQLHHKDTFRWVEGGVVDVYGSKLGHRVSKKSAYRKSLIYEDMHDLGYRCNFVRPVMDWRPWRLAALDMVNPYNNIDTKILKLCSNSYITGVEALLPEEAYDDIMIYSDKVAINGATGVKFVDKLNRSTSMGYPWSTCKKAYMIPLAGEVGEDLVDFTEEIKFEVDRMIENYSQGYLMHPVFSAHIKDEAISAEKSAAGKGRVFTGSPVHFTIVMRKFFLSITRLIQLNGIAFEAAPGVNCMSYQWQNIYDHITKFGVDRMVAGDYSKFDKKMSPIFIIEAFSILIHFMKKRIDNPDYIRIMWCIAFDTAYPTVLFNGTFVRFYGSNPSGHALTVIINCIVNSLYMRYAYTLLNPAKECVSFKENVALITYGDDNVSGVSKHCSFFNHTSVSEILTKIGVFYTMADKTSESKPFIGMSEVSFLKRNFQMHEDLPLVVGCLEFNSIIKMLMVGLTSNSITEEERVAMVILSANREIFFYGREMSSKYRVVFLQIMTKYDLFKYLPGQQLATYDTLLGELLPEYDPTLCDKE